MQTVKKASYLWDIRSTRHLESNKQKQVCLFNKQVQSGKEGVEIDSSPNQLVNHSDIIRIQQLSTLLLSQASLIYALSRFRFRGTPRIFSLSGLVSAEGTDCMKIADRITPSIAFLAV